MTKLTKSREETLHFTRGGLAFAGAIVALLAAACAGETVLGSTEGEAGSGGSGGGSSGTGAAAGEEPGVGGSAGGEAAGGTGGGPAGGTGGNSVGGSGGGTGGDSDGGAAGDSPGATGGGTGGNSEGGTGGQVIPPPPGDAHVLAYGGADKLDLLLVVDNSISMADKQELLANAVPSLLGRLADPPCVDPVSGAVTDESSQDGCPNGSIPEFQAATDVHIGVITSSLGGHGGTLCSPEYGEQYWNPTQNDMAHLISRVDSTGDPGEVSTWNNLGFLSWDPTGNAQNPSSEPPGESDAAALVSNFQSLVLGAGEQGCGYEAPLEAMYRFLVDPEPPLDVQVDPVTQMSTPVGLDDDLLTQRATFLRPDSAVLIVLLTDEDDCSVNDYQYGYLITQPSEGEMPRSTSVCDTNPNDPCCLSCIQASWPDACPNPQEDPKCVQALMQPREEDRLNLRCWDNKRRFGLDFLYPTSRYVNGLTAHEVPMRDGSMVPNPLFAPSNVYPGLSPRVGSSRVFLAGILGVPWQDIATDASLADPASLEFLSADEIAARGIWNDILGDPGASPPVPPNDPFMRQSIEPRSGTNPRTGIDIEPPTPGPGGNAINGHEYTILNNCDLQYSCIFPLQEPRECENVEPGVGCDCKMTPDVEDRPLCDDLTQLYAKAYPAPRILSVLRDFGSNSILTSICPKNPSNGDDGNQALHPAASAITARVADALRAAPCLAEALPVDDDSMLACRVVEVTRGENPAPCTNDLPGRTVPDAELRNLAWDHLEYQGICGGQSGACDELSLCEIKPAGETFDSIEYRDCLHLADIDGDPAPGFCYVDAERQPAIGNDDLVSECPPGQKRTIRMVTPPGSDVPIPWPDSTILIVCPED